MYHLVWIPKYRKRVLSGALAKRLEELFKQCAEVNGWEIHELNIQANHVHMLVQLFKGGSSKIVREEFPELEEFLWGDSFWGEGYFVETIGSLNEEKMREYIKNQ